MLVMVAGYPRCITARMLPSRSAADLIAGHWRLSTELGAVPRVLVWDNEGAVARGGLAALNSRTNLLHSPGRWRSSSCSASHAIQRPRV